VPIQVLPNHVRVPAMACRVVGWSTKHFSKKSGDVLRVLEERLAEWRRQKARDRGR
jgi:hypothetical protein